ncbi:MAG TPA: hypothetical protein VHC94_00045 [Nitrobacter sp.]|nr:hypothetical protein [Nitrobacter sp.]
MGANRGLWIGAVTLGCAVAVSMPARAQWWSSTPRDYEDCAANARKTAAASADDRTNALADCEAKFAGRRKPGGGYTYYDFMQNRHFDLAGPNPTAAEQKYIDEQYMLYLSEQRRSLIEAAFSRKQHEVELAKAASDGKTPANRKHRAARLAAPPKLAAPRVAVLPRPRPKPVARCKGDDFFSSCRWPRISSGVQDLKKALSSFVPKDARS